MMKSRRMNWAEYVPCMRENRNTNGFGGKARWKETITKPRRRWKNNTKMDLGYYYYYYYY
jgi:hypothetical protein